MEIGSGFTDAEQAGHIELAGIRGKPGRLLRGQTKIPELERNPGIEQLIEPGGGAETAITLRQRFASMAGSALGQAAEERIAAPALGIRREKPFKKVGFIEVFIAVSFKKEGESSAFDAAMVATADEAAMSRR